jgi:hypothetical protein
MQVSPLLCLHLVAGKTKKYTFEAVIDTGASCNAISYDMVKKLGYSINASNRKTFGTANGQQTSYGSATFNCVTSDYDLGDVEFDVCGTTMPVLISIRFLQSYEASLHMGSNIMKIAGVRIPLSYYTDINIIKVEALFDEDIINKIITNIVNNPTNPKYKKIPLNSKLMSTTRYETLTYLQSIGFTVDDGQLVYTKVATDLKRHILV